MRRITIDEVNSMSKEEVQELQKKLAARAFGKFLLLMAGKWVLIFWSTRSLRKFIESLQER